MKELRNKDYNVHVINPDISFRKEQGRFHEFFFDGPRPFNYKSAMGVAGEVKTLIGRPLKPNAVFNHADKAANKQLQPSGGVLFFNLRHITTNDEQLHFLLDILKTGKGINRPLPRNVEVVFIR